MAILPISMVYIPRLSNIPTFEKTRFLFHDFPLSRISQFSLKPGERQILEGLVVRRANALLLLDDGMSASDVGRVLYLDV